MKETAMSTIRTGRRAVVVHESMFGNTRAVAEAVAEGLRLEGFDVAASDVGQARAATALRADLLVLGAPTHAFSLSRASTRADAVRQGAPASRAATGLREWLSTLRGDATSGGPLVAVFDTRVAKVRRLPAAAGPAAVRLARRQGLRLLGKPAGFCVEDTAGPLCDGELDRARDWGRALGRTVQRAPSTLKAS
jgi:hypothetical protein